MEKKASKEGVCPVEDNLEPVRTLGDGLVHGQELKSIIFVGPLQLSIFCELRGYIEKTNIKCRIREENVPENERKGPIRIKIVHVKIIKYKI